MMSEIPPAPNRGAARANISGLDARPAVRRTLLALIVVVAVWLRLHGLVANSFWLDEGVSVEIARLRWTQFVLVLWRREVNMSFYYLLLHYWMRVSSSEAFVRGLSVIFAAATVPAVYALGKRLFGAATGLAAAWLLAINAYHAYYSQDARSYTLLVFLVTLSTWILVRNVQQPSSARWRAYTLVSVFSLYSHFFAALVIVAQAASLAWLRPREFAWRDYARSLRWIVYFAVPLAVIAARIGVAPVDWIPRTTAAGVYLFFDQITGMGGKPLIALDALAIALAAISAARPWRANGEFLKRWPGVLVFGWLFVPVALTIAASFARPIFEHRYLLICTPALMLCVAVGIVEARPRALGWLIFAAISVLSLHATRAHFYQDFYASREDWRSASAYILDHEQPGDGILFTPLGRLPYEYYRSQRNPVPAGPQVLYAPGGTELVWQDFMVPPLGEMLSNARPAPDRVWVVTFWNRLPNGDFDRTTVMLNAVYGKGRHLIDAQEFPRITVELFAADANVPGK